ncbi:MAG: cellulase family glycosylhydrolase [Candidatus Portnoybacteria bacterium]|nr:cellulase family glycosylhydrolase [Candidatus Portnoybacteria bacterium]
MENIEGENSNKQNTMTATKQKVVVRILIGIVLIGLVGGGVLIFGFYWSIPPIVVLSPNGGETWNIGKSYVIQWSVKAGYGNKRVDVSLKPSTTALGQSTVTVEKNTQNDGVTLYAVASNVKSGDYLVNVKCVDNTCNDTSNSPFKIQGTTTPPPATLVSNIKSVTWYDFGVTAAQSYLNLQAALPKMKSTGFNTVWLVNAWRNFNPQPLATPPIYNEQSFSDLKKVLDLLRANNMKAIIGLNYLGKGWEPEGIDKCKWITDSVMYNSFEAYAKEFMTRISSYGDMAYVLFFTENSEPCGPKPGAGRDWNAYTDAKEIADLLRATLGSLPNRLPADLRSKFKMGYHDYSLITLNWAGGVSPTLNPNPFDFLSTVAYGFESKTDQQIKDEIDLRASRFKALHPAKPLIIGEFGATSCNAQDANQARVDTTIVSHALSKAYGFNLWGWKPGPGDMECAGPPFGGLAITNQDGTLKKAANDLKAILNP